MGFFIAFAIFQKVVLVRLKKITERTKSDIDDELIKIVQSMKPPFYSFLAFYIAARFLVLSNIIENIINVILIVWFIYQIISVVQILINYIVRKKVSAEDRQSRAAAGAIGVAAKIVLWSLAFLLVLQNLGVNVNSLIAGLGIGGIAVALAAQNILGDLFSSFAIYFDKPFVPGDFIVFGKTMDTVEKIGIKTTRLRALQGEEIIVFNKDLTAAQIQNFKKMKRRRVVFDIGVVYETPVEKLKTVPSIVKNTIESTKGLNLDRVHFKQFADSALLFEVAYYVESDDYNEYMNLQQEMNFKIKESFEKEGIAMAYPTQTLYFKK